MAVDYFVALTPDDFDFSQPFNDDFFQAGRSSSQVGYFVSASELPMVVFDSIGYVQFGDNTARIIRRSGYGKN